MSIIFLWLAGIVTYFSLQQPNIAEANLALSNALERYGLWVVFVFDAGASMIFILIYQTTKRNVIFSVCIMLMLLSATAFDLTNNLSFLYAPQLYDTLNFANQKPVFASFTRAEYDGLYLRDFVISCIGRSEVLKVPLGKPVYVGSGWTDIHEDRESIMHC